jgi:hypothetical protein
MSDKIKIRKLTNKDFRVLKKFLSELTQKAEYDWLKSAIRESSPNSPEQSEGGTGTEEVKNGEVMVRLFAAAIRGICQYFDDEVTGWFADLCGQTVEDYLELPFGTDLCVIEAIKESEEFKDFFSKACALFNLQSLFGKVWQKLKTTYDSMTD